MSKDQQQIDKYYVHLFTVDPLYSTPYPNIDEAVRLSKIIEFLSQIPNPYKFSSQHRLRILDVGCGRGWLTRLASIYGECHGIDPAEDTIKFAQKYFPELSFYAGSLEDILEAPNFLPYDVVISSEVIEHVLDKEKFISDIRKCLMPKGHVIITTPRGEEFKKYLKEGYDLQPIEEWISEKDLCSLFKNQRFIPVKHDRAYIDLPNMSIFHKLAASSKFSSILNKLGLIWIHKGLQYTTGIYQVWWFQLSDL